ncbi:hypothetical protein M758_UG343700 [Ceratodon purpureus]|nr:hypothetical protein M758_UG343700 [Ceratodon purpureus]
MTERTDELRSSHDLPMSEEMEKRSTSRLSAMERIQADKSRRLDDIFSRCGTIQNLLQSVISTLSTMHSS